MSFDPQVQLTAQQNLAQQKIGEDQSFSVKFGKNKINFTVSGTKDVFHAASGKKITFDFILQTTSAVADTNTDNRTQRDQLIKGLENMGLTRADAEELADMFTGKMQDLAKEFTIKQGTISIVGGSAMQGSGKKASLTDVTVTLNSDPDSQEWTLQINKDGKVIVPLTMQDKMTAAQKKAISEFNDEINDTNAIATSTVVTSDAKLVALEILGKLNSEMRQIVLDAWKEAEDERSAQAKETNKILAEKAAKQKFNEKVAMAKALKKKGEQQFSQAIAENNALKKKAALSLLGLAKITRKDADTHLPGIENGLATLNIEFVSVAAPASSASDVGVPDISVSNLT